MAFKKNSHQQINFNDSFHNLTDREKKFLEKSWAKAFGDEIFYKIDEEPFEVLYSDKPSRPNTPVNVIIGSLLLKELLNLTDDELVESLMFDIRYQYALNTTSFEEQPLSDRSLSRFRERVLAYEEQTGIDLMKNCILELSSELAKLMNLSTNIQRMDSMMIASNIRKLSRIELVYTCVYDLLKELQEEKLNFPKTMNHYLEEDDRNKTFYHSKKEDYDQIVEEILADAMWLKEGIKGRPRNLQTFQNLLRILEEQTVEEDHQVRFKTNEEKVPSSSLQSPKDPDATYRIKGKEEHIGYVANITETVDKKQGLSLITDYDYDQNIKSDSSFVQDKLNRDGKQEEKTTLIADGSYGGIENKELAKKNNIDLITTKLQGRDTDTIFAKFEFDKDKKTCLKCAKNHKPIKSTYYEKSGQTRIKMEKQACLNCPYIDKCNPIEQQKSFYKDLSWKTTERAKHIEFMGTEKFKELSYIRNGIEAIPSILRRKLRVDTMPFRRLLPSKLSFAFKLGSINIKKAIDFLLRPETERENKLIVAGT